MPPLVHSVFMLAVTITFVLFMAFSIGGNDVANSFGISVGTGTLSMKQALMVAAVFEVGGAVFTAAAFAFSHGSNDIANAVGLFAAILDVLSTGEINAKAAVPGELMLAAGLWFIGPKVIMTVGSGLMKMHPASGFAAELSAAGVVMIASLLGLPVSSTHILIGAILGVGIVNKAANWSLMNPIALAWVITVPAAALVGSVGVLALQAVFG